MAGSSYCTRSDVLAILSQDSEARLTTDPGRAVAVGIGDGNQTDFDLPFMGASTITVLLSVPNDPAPVFEATLLPGAGTNGVDLVRFATAPTSGAVITAKADQKAVDITIVDRAIADAADEIDSYMPQNVTPLQLPDLVRRVRPKAVFLVKWRLRRRRDQQEWDPIMVEYAQTYKWLNSLASGIIGLPTATAELAIDVAGSSVAGASFGEETTGVFGPPFSALSGRDF